MNQNHFKIAKKNFLDIDCFLNEKNNNNNKQKNKSLIKFGLKNMLRSKINRW